MEASKFGPAGGFPKSLPYSKTMMLVLLSLGCKVATDFDLLSQGNYYFYFRVNDHYGETIL